MCYSDDARPPLPPVVGGAASNHGDFHLTASDGNRFMAHHARAESPTGSGMVILPDVRGLHPFYKELAVRFAEAGVDAVALDYFGRTAENEDRGEDFDWKPQVTQITPEGLASDVRACIDYLGTADGGRPRAAVTGGVCAGGVESSAPVAQSHGPAGG